MRLLDYFRLVQYGAEKPARFINYLRLGVISRVFVVVSHEKKLVYIVNPKVASTSIATFMVEKTITKEERERHAIKDKHKLLNKVAIKSYDELKAYQEKGYFVFSVVRNPFSRLVSFYKSKFEMSSSGVLIPRKFAIHKDFHNLKGFADVARKVCTIPDAVADSHFMSQSAIIYGLDKSFSPNFVGKIESLDDDLEVVRSQFSGERISKENATQSEKDDWLTYFTPELADLVSRRFNNDVENFGYEPEWKNLQHYLVNQDN